MKKAEKRLALHTRPPLGRMRHIVARLRRGDYPSRTVLARELEVTIKTIQRDITFLTDRMEIPLAYDPSKKGYNLTGPVNDFSSVTITESELLALLVGQKALAQYRGTPFEAPLRRAFEKLSTNLEGSITISWNDLDEAISFRSIPAHPAELKLFQDLTRAVREHREVFFQYRKLNTSMFQLRRVEPYHLACVAGQWYLFGRDVKADKIRTFVLPRMRELKTTEWTFTVPRDFSIQNLLQGSFTVFEGKNDYRVRVRFNAYAAQFIRERIWHHSQKLKELPKLEVELSLKLSSLVEVEQWILSWGSHATVVEPPELVARIISLSRQNLQKYSSAAKRLRLPK